MSPMCPAEGSAPVSSLQAEAVEEATLGSTTSQQARGKGVPGKRALLLTASAGSDMCPCTNVVQVQG